MCIRDRVCAQLDDRAQLGGGLHALGNDLHAAGVGVSHHIAQDLLCLLYTSTNGSHTSPKWVTTGIRPDRLYPSHEAIDFYHHYEEDIARCV